MRDFRKIIAWQKAHVFAIGAQRVLVATRHSMPAHARIQLEKATSSISSNISEGSGKRTDPEFARFLDIAMGSAKESQNRLMFAHDAEWIADADYLRLEQQLDEVCRVLHGFTESVLNRMRREALAGRSKQRAPSQQ